MIARVFFLFLCGLIFAHLGYAQKLPKVKKLNMKVHFNITSDTLTMRFHRPNQSIKLEGFILGYGSNYFTNQYIQWPDNGKAFVTDVDAETRYLIAVKPNDNPKKGCKEKNSSQKPLQVVIGTLTPTSVFLSWGILINPQVDWSALSKCPNDRFYTVRYREKNKDWNFQLCPTTETVIDNLRPNTMYEFGVKDNNDEIWGTPQNHKTTPKGKENGNMENTYKIPKGTLQYASEDTKALIPVIVVKQGFQNITRSTAALPPTVQSPVLREVTKKPPLTTTRPSTPKPKPVSKVTDSPPTPKASEKIIVEDPKPAATSKTIVESFTPDSSTGTLEWVRATMVTHPYAPVTNIPTESSVIDELSSPLAFVQESYDLPSEAPAIEILKSVPSLQPPKDKIAFPTFAPVPFTNELPVVQPDTVLASDQMATYMPKPMTVMHAIPGDVPESIDVPQVSTDIHIKLSTTSGIHPIPTLVPKKSTRLPSKKRTTTIAAKTKQPKYGSTTISSLEKAQTYHATTSQQITNKQSTLSSQTHKKPTTAFIGSSNLVTTPKTTIKTAAPHPTPAAKKKRPINGSKTISSPEEAPSYPASTESPKLVTTPKIIIKTASPLPTPAAKKKHPVYGSTTISSLEKAQTYHASDDNIVVEKRTSTSKSHATVAYRTKTTPLTTNTPTSSQRTQSTQASKRQRVTPAERKIPLPKKTQPTTATISHVPVKQSTLSSKTYKKNTTVPNESLLFYPKAVPSTETPDSEADSTLPESEIYTTDAPYIYEAEKSTLAYRTKTTPLTTNTPTTSQRTQSTQASKRQRVTPAERKIPLPKKTLHTTGIVKAFLLCLLQCVLSHRSS